MCRSPTTPLHVVDYRMKPLVSCATWPMLGEPYGATSVVYKVVAVVPSSPSAWTLLPFICNNIIGVSRTLLSAES